MGSEFATYFRLGVGHIADLQGSDHILFIVALTAGYAARDWRRLLWLVTAFTIGHSVTLALATLRLVRVHAPTVELLIAATIVAAAGYSLLSALRGEGAGSGKSAGRHRLLYLLAGAFGLIHGLGFSSFLRALLGGEESIVVPLLAFNVGLETGQLAIVVVVVVAGALTCDVAGLARRWWVAALSAVIVVLGVRMLLERL